MIREQSHLPIDSNSTVSSSDRNCSHMPRMTSFHLSRAVNAMSHDITSRLGAQFYSHEGHRQTHAVLS